MKIADFEPVMEDREPNERGYQCLTFLCPACRRLRVQVAIWARPHGEVRWTDADGNACFERVWNAMQGPHRDWDTLSLSPSLDMAAHKLSGGRDDCPGWHGFIADGEVQRVLSADRQTAEAVPGTNT